MVSCRSPFFPKIVIITSSSKLASLPLKSVALDASTVKILWFPSILEKVSPFERRVTSCGAGGGAFCFSRCAAHLRSRYTPAVRLASSNAAAADQRAYFAASLLFISSVKQNFDGVYRRGNVGLEEGMSVQKKERINQPTRRSPPDSAKSRYSPPRRCRAWYSSPGTWPHRQGAAILPWFVNPRGRMPRPRWASAGYSTLQAPAICPRGPICVNAAPRSTRCLSKSAAAGLQTHPRRNGTRNRSAGNVASAHFRSPPAAASPPGARAYRSPA